VREVPGVLGRSTALSSKTCLGFDHHHEERGKGLAFNGWQRAVVQQPTAPLAQRATLQLDASRSIISSGRVRLLARAGLCSSDGEPQPLGRVLPLAATTMSDVLASVAEVHAVLEGIVAPKKKASVRWPNVGWVMLCIALSTLNAIFHRFPILS
jgi:hypothetical protein